MRIIKLTKKAMIMPWMPVNKKPSSDAKIMIPTFINNFLWLILLMNLLLLSNKFKLSSTVSYKRRSVEPQCGHFSPGFVFMNFPQCAHLVIFLFLLFFIFNEKLNRICQAGSDRLERYDKLQIITYLSSFDFFKQSVDRLRKFKI